MRLFSWYGLGTVLIALASGYAAGVAHRPCDCPSCYPPPIPSREEEATPPPPPPGFAQVGPRIAPPETIDLTVPPSVLMAFEPPTPIVDAETHQVKFEFPSGSDTPPYMPYLDEETCGFITGLNAGFTSDLDSPIRSASFQYEVPPICNPRASFTAIALGYSLFAN